MQKIYSVEKSIPCVFFQKWLKNGTFSIFFYFQFFNHFWKNTQGIVFQRCIFLHISPLPQPIKTKTLHLTVVFCGQTCCFGKTITYFFSSKNVINCELWPIKSLFQKKYLFRKMSLHKLFQSKLLICIQNKNKTNGVSFIWKLKAKRFQNTWTYTMTKEFGEEMILQT